MYDCEEVNDIFKLNKSIFVKDPGAHLHQRFQPIRGLEPMFLPLEKRTNLFANDICGGIQYERLAGTTFTKSYWNQLCSTYWNQLFSTFIEGVPVFLRLYKYLGCG